MPDELTQKLLDRLDELEIKINQKNNEVQDLTLELNKLRLLIKNHRHQGGETIPIETLIKNAQYIDGKEFRVSGTTGADGTFISGDESAKTITVSKGIITSITS